ncbi:hypothetical protein EGJ86_22150 [Pseudomonas sp. o96-267]|uniref:hypothetical protein n=1 Tax=Pseudomonas sp. o96-267 TaxID=2479853 RepID=UPI000F76EABE|nr:MULTISPECIES: hypothetical protein [Pseudomonas]MDH0960927.1 hypothetical protein [Pseudomonas chengduensis]MDV5863655.1 hypothetical protein [Pseudomonas mendocina]RRV29944.1 hypothetical protein EGJ86_22150 [Pseudomonas sp. o96-267]
MQALINDTVNESLSALSSALNGFKAACLAQGGVLQGTRFNAIDGVAEAGSPAELLVDAVSAWDIPDESVKGSVARFPGVFEVSAQVIAAAAALNAEKERLAMAVNALSEGGSDSRKMRLAYRASGHPRLHPLQAQRQIVILQGEGLSRVGFTVAKQGHSIRVMTYTEAVAELGRNNAYDVIEQIQSMPESSVIHWHTPVSRHIRANVVWDIAGSRKSQMFHASLPFLVQEGFWPSKWVRFPTPRTHTQRRDQKGTLLANVPLRAGAYLSVT